MITNLLSIAAQSANLLIKFVPVFETPQMEIMRGFFVLLLDEIGWMTEITFVDVCH